MPFPDINHLRLYESTVQESSLGAGRLAFWVDDSLRDGKRLRTRVVDISGPEIVQRCDCHALPVMCIPVEEDVLAPWQRWWRRLRGIDEDYDYLTPEGLGAVVAGEKRTDALLIWGAEGGETCNESRIRELWPEISECRQLGANLHLAVGASEQVTFAEANRQRRFQELLHAQEDHRDELLRPEHDPLRQAEEQLQQSLQRGDTVPIAVAHIDLGSILTRSDRAAEGLEHLQDGLRLARASGDATVELDALLNLGIAHLAAGTLDEASNVFHRVIQSARTLDEPYTEKTSLGHLGEIYIRLGQPQLALVQLDAALQLAIRVNDPGAEALYRWNMAICFDELGRKDEAIDYARVASHILTRLNSPQASAFEEYAETLEHGMSPTSRSTAPSSLPTDGWSAVLAAEPLIAGSLSPELEAISKGPSVLRMAYTAGRAMAKFVASGFKTVSRVAHDERLATCQACAHHTGVRCKLCGCFTSKKTWLPYEYCPAGKWPV